MAHGMSGVNGYVSRKDLFYVNPKSIKVINGFNPRTDFSGEQELMTSIINIGVLEPIEVRKNKNKELELVDGERRLRATLKAIELGNDIKAVPCVLVPQKTNEIDLLVRALTRNTGKPLTPVEEANSFKKLNNWGWKIEKIAEFIGRSVPYVYKRLELCAASPELEEAINKKEVTLTEAHKIINKTDGKISEQKTEITKTKEIKKEKKKEKEAIKKSDYNKKIMEFLKYKKELNIVAKKLDLTFNIRNDDLDYDEIKNVSSEMIDLLNNIIEKI